MKEHSDYREAADYASCESAAGYRRVWLVIMSLVYGCIVGYLLTWGLTTSHWFNNISLYLLIPCGIVVAGLVARWCHWILSTP